MSFTERPTITGWLVNRLTYGRSMYATSMAGNASGGGSYSQNIIWVLRSNLIIVRACRRANQSSRVAQKQQRHTDDRPTVRPPAPTSSWRKGYSTDNDVLCCSILLLPRTVWLCSDVFLLFIQLRNVLWDGGGKYGRRCSSLSFISCIVIVRVCSGYIGCSTAITRRWKIF